MGQVDHRRGKTETAVSYGRPGQATDLFQRARSIRIAVADGAERLRRAVEAADLWVLHEIDPQALLMRGGYAIEPARQILFFHPRLMARLLAADPTALLEAPLKFALLALPNGTLIVRWIDPAWALARYDSSELKALGHELATACEGIARAWVDPVFRARLLANGRKACEKDFDISFYGDTEIIVLENTEKVHNLIVCTLCSCYPRPVLGLPPDWYKLKPFRARAVIEPRAVLAEFGTIIPDDVEVHVHDSTAMVRYLVLPRRPDGTGHYSEAQLAALVTRDTMIGVAKASPERTAL
jgi:uncharacterized protein (DUF302 family)